MDFKPYFVKQIGLEVDRVMSIKIKVMLIIGLSFPIIAMFIGLATAYAYHEDILFVNTTHCTGLVKTRIASISTIGSFYPQKLLWAFAFYMYCCCRLFWGWSYCNFYKHSMPYVLTEKWSCWYKFLNAAMKFDSLMELVGLWMAFSVTADEIFSFHAAGFVIFVTAFCFYTFCNIWLHYLSGFYKVKRKTFWIKLFINLSLIAISFSSAELYYLYDVYCSVLAFQAFALLEYATMLLNACFHALLYFELEDYRITMFATWTPTVVKSYV